jgi:hypothetical protein
VALEKVSFAETDRRSWKWQPLAATPASFCDLQRLATDEER